MRMKTEAKRESILAAASEVFREAGFEGASMAEIAARVGGSKATLYGYFKSKEELFIGVMHNAAEKQFEPIFAALGSEGEDLPRTLQSFGERTLNILCSEASIQTWRAIISEAGRSDIGLRFFLAGPQKGMLQMAAFLQGQMSRGYLKQGDPLLAATQWNALLECETVTPLLLGIEKTLSKARIKLAVRRALQTFLASYAANPEAASGEEMKAKEAY